MSVSSSESWLWVSFFGCIAMCFTAAFAGDAYKSGEQSKATAAQDALVFKCVEAGREIEACREAFAESEFTECVHAGYTPSSCADALEDN
jgi:hypothetical protein